MKWNTRGLGERCTNLTKGAEMEGSGCYQIQKWMVVSVSDSDRARQGFGR